jgi:hypothetical protein
MARFWSDNERWRDQAEHDGIVSIKVSYPHDYVVLQDVRPIDTSCVFTKRQFITSCKQWKRHTKRKHLKCSVPKCKKKAKVRGERLCGFHAYQREVPSDILKLIEHVVI